MPSRGSGLENREEALKVDPTVGGKKLQNRTGNGAIVLN
jgi:hypothetical protein